MKDLRDCRARMRILRNHRQIGEWVSTASHNFLKIFFLVLVFGFVARKFKVGFSCLGPVAGVVVESPVE